jgi:hypothetical protein
MRQNPGSWLFAMPLASVSPHRLIEHKLSIIDLVALGHPLDSRSTFSVPATLSDVMEQVSINLQREIDREKKSADQLKRSCLQIFSQLSKLQSTSAKGALDLDAADSQFSPHIELRLIDDEGEMVELNAPITTQELAGFLANYLNEGLEAEISRLETLLAPSP